MLKNNYYFSSFFWSTLQKVLNAVLGFISVPLLLGYYGKAEYGILAIATACNGYMHLLDLGMNTGAIKFFSQWKVDKKYDLIYRVARTNISFYLFIAFVNIILLVTLAICGESIFSVTHEQFQQLRICLFIIALFAVFSWGTTTFNQLLVADKQMAYTMKIQCVQTVLKTLLIFIALWTDLTLTVYFFWLTFILALLFIPYAIKCRRDGLIDSLRPAAYWKDFRIVLNFSLSIFVLSLFQMTATQSRPIILSIFSENGAETVSEYRIIEVIPQLIIMIGGTFSSIFLPRTAEIVAQKNRQAIEAFAYKWTVWTSVLANVLSIPFVFCASEVLSAYVGVEYAGLSYWMIIWCLTVLVQIHTTPGNALVLAYGCTRPLVITSALACIVSMVINVILSFHYGVGSAVIGYFIYVVIVIGSYYIFYYKKLIGLNRWKMFQSFLIPTGLAVILLILVKFVPVSPNDFPIFSPRLQYISVCIVKTLLWLIPYVVLLIIFHVIDVKSLKK